MLTRLIGLSRIVCAQQGAEKLPSTLQHEESQQRSIHATHQVMSKTLHFLF